MASLLDHSKVLLAAAGVEILGSRDHAAFVIQGATPR